jgi:hypothetical protein
MELASWYGSIGLIAPTIELSAHITNHEAAASVEQRVLHRPVELAGTYRALAISMMPLNDQKRLVAPAADCVANRRVGLLLFCDVDKRFADGFDSAAYQRLHLA